MDPELHILAGAPEMIWTMTSIAPIAGTIDLDSDTAGSTGGGIAVEMEFRMFNKTATRLPESIFVVLRPDSRSGSKTASQSSMSDVLRHCQVSGMRNDATAKAVRPPSPPRAKAGLWLS